MLSHARAQELDAQLSRAQSLYPQLLLAISGCALIPALSGVLFGFSGSDTQFHMGSWVDTVADWQSGVVLPGWAEHANYGFGDPRFCFYPLLPIFFGALLLYALPLSLVMGTLFFLAFATAGFAMFRLARRFVSERRAIVAAVLYQTSFFLLITALKHAAVAELMADALLPLLIGHFVDTFIYEKQSSWPWLAIFLSLIWLIDVPVAVGTFYVLTLSSIFLAGSRGRWRQLLWLFAAEAVAVVIASVYIFPAYAARHTVLFTGQLEYHLRTLFSSPVPQDITLSANALALFAVVACLGWRWRSRTNLQAPYGVLLTGVTAFCFQLPMTKLLWRLPQMHLVGFPHRLQVFLAIAFSIAVVVGSTRRVLAVSVLLSFVVAVVPFYALYSWTKRSGPLPTAHRLLATSLTGYQGAPEYVPTGAGAILVNQDNQAVATTVPETQAVGNGCEVQAQTWLPQHKAVQVANASDACSLTLRLFIHPYWRFTVDGLAATPVAGRYGLAVIKIGHGNHNVSADFKRPIKPLIEGCGFTTLGILLLLFGTRVMRLRGWGLRAPREELLRSHL